jgi:hypothetical protein
LRWHPNARYQIPGTASETVGRKYATWRPFSYLTGREQQARWQPVHEILLRAAPMVLRPQRTDGSRSPSDQLSEAQPGHISDATLSMPVGAANSNSVDASTKKGRAFTITFLIASAVAMFGWLTGLGWVAVSAVKWLFDQF